MPAKSDVVISRRGLLGVFASTAVVAAAPAQAGVFGFLKGAGDVRRVRLFSQRTGERVDTIYWIEGQYVPEALAEINHFMRDWRQNEVIDYDRRNIDIIAAVQRLLETDEAFNLLSGYRSPKTNAMLRQRNRGVASNSYHTKGMAADLQMRGRTVNQVAGAAQACHAGGVGRYYRSSFTHIDCGPIRSWKS